MVNREIPQTNMLWALPSCAILVSGTGEGTTALNAFDAALYAAGIGDFNLIKVSSILPPGVSVDTYADGGAELIDTLPRGVLLPTVYSSVTSPEPGASIAAAVAVGIPHDRRLVGTIFEVGVFGKREDAEDLVRRMVEESLALRAVQGYEVVVASSEALVTSRFVCVLSAVVLPIS